MRILPIVLILALFTLQATPQNRDTVYTGVIQGTLTRTGSSEPIANVQITLSLGGSPLDIVGFQTTLDGIRPGSLGLTVLQSMARAVNRPPNPVPPRTGPTPGPYTTTTDASGHFSFSGLAPGLYTVLAKSEGYFGLSTESALWYVGARSPVIITAQQNPPAVTLSLARGASVHGIIRDPEGNPAVHATIAALRLDHNQSQLKTTVMATNTTDEQGRYLLSLLPPGEYAIGVVPPVVGGRGSQEVPKLANGDSWVRTYYPNVVDPLQAQSVAVADGADIYGIDIAIRTVSPSVTYKVSGHRIGDCNRAMSSFELRMSVPDPVAVYKSQSFRNTATDISNGKFELDGVPPGSYVLAADCTQLQGRETFGTFGRVRVNVTNGDVKDVEVHLSPGIDVTVHAVDGKLSPLPTSALLPDLSPSAKPPDQPVFHLEGTDITSEGRVNSSYNAEGEIVFSNVPDGTYRILGVTGFDMKLTGNSYLADVRQNGVSVFDSGFALGPNYSSDLQLVVRNDLGRIDGVVAGVDPINGDWTIFAVPKQDRRQNPALYEMAIARASYGRRIGLSLPPGEYKLFAWPAATAPSLPSLRNADFIAKYESLGTSVKVQSGISVNVTVPLILKDPAKP